MSATIVLVDASVRREIRGYACMVAADPDFREQISNEIMDYLNDKNQVSDAELEEWLYGSNQRTIADIAHDIGL